MTPETISNPRKTASALDTEPSQGSSQVREWLFPFLDLRAQFATIDKEVMGAVTRVMENQQFILGPEVQFFEREIAAFVGVRSAVGCASGTDALLLSLLVLNIGPGHEVITTPFTFIATAGAVIRTGARPVFVDIDPETFNIDPDLIRAAITKRTRAIMPVHLFGLAADMDPILKLAAQHRLAIIEDAAQAIGARYKGAKVGALGTLGCFSFFPSKNLGGAGDGGMVTTNDPELADQLQAVRVHGSRRKYYSEVQGTNSRLDALQAAILRVKLRHLDAWIRARQCNADRYHAIFLERGLNEFLTIPSVPANCNHVYNQFTIRSRQRDQLREFLRRRGIPTEVYYPYPLHLQPAFSDLECKEGQFPHSEAASREVLSLPVYPELNEDQQSHVVRAIAEFYGARA